MCTGLETPALIALYGSLASTAVGTGLSIKAKRDTQAAQRRASDTELMHKRKVEQDSKNLFNNAVTQANPAQAGADADAQAAAQYAATKEGVDAAPIGFGPETVMGSADSVNPVVKESAARSLADALQTADGQVKANAMLRGIGLQRQQRSRQLERAGQSAQQIGNFMQGWGNVGNFQQELAAHAGDNTAMLGDALTGLGQVGMAYAGTQKPATPISSDPYMSTWGQTGSDNWFAPTGKGSSAMGNFR